MTKKNTYNLYVNDNQIREKRHITYERINRKKHGLTKKKKKVRRKKTNRKKTSERKKKVFGILEKQLCAQNTRKKLTLFFHRKTQNYGMVTVFFLFRFTSIFSVGQAKNTINNHTRNAIIYDHIDFGFFF